ncbi:TPA_exp: Aldehyde reductase II [Trichophyton benhamiae CBS 112371]|nr:TPA_exp: Aldehyde reductase II [Trichophyton benhamiae CBS 112371]
MPFTNSDLVVVTGANGHVAQHVVSQLLSFHAPVRVRGTVRSSMVAQKLYAAFESFVSSGRLEIAIVPDLTVDGAFDDALQGATYVAHIASPLNMSPENVENDLLIPAIKGNICILESIMKQTGIKAVVITSSFVAAFDARHGFREGYAYSSADWNPISYDEAADPRHDMSQYQEMWRPWVTYMASRKLAEKAAWDFYRKHQPTWALSTLLPSFIGGPFVLPLTKGTDSLTFSTGLIWRTALGNEPLFHNDFPHWVDVRDVAKAHIQALITPAAWGRRLMLGPWPLLFSDIARIVRKHYPEMSPSREKQEVHHYSIDSVSSLSILGMNSWISPEQMIVNLIKQLKRTTLSDAL